MLSSSGFPGPDPTPPGPSAGIGRACARTCGSPLALHTPQRNSEGEREGLWRLRAVCRRAGPRGRGSSSPRDACASSRLHFPFTAVTTGAASRLQRGARVHRPAPLSSPVAGYPRECEPPGSQTSPGKSRPLGSRRWAELPSHLSADPLAASPASVASCYPVHHSLKSVPQGQPREGKKAARG